MPLLLSVRDETTKWFMYHYTSCFSLSFLALPCSESDKWEVISDSFVSLIVRWIVELRDKFFMSSSDRNERYELGHERLFYNGLCLFDSPINRKQLYSYPVPIPDVNRSPCFA